jgi:hypothetical protein
VKELAIMIRERKGGGVEIACGNNRHGRDPTPKEEEMFRSVQGLVTAALKMVYRHWPGTIVIEPGDL